MKFADIAGLTPTELGKRRNELRQGLFEARMKNALGQLTNPMTIRQMRRDVARIATVMNGKPAAAAKKTSKAKGKKA